MLTSRIRDVSSSWNNQLSLNFTHSPSSAKTRIADSVYAITSSNITFHPEQSEIGENNFALKISYMGRSYSLKGLYKKEYIRSFDQEEFSSTTVRIIRFDSILAFRDGRYVSAFLPPKDYNELTKNAQNILSGHCQSITIH